MDEILNEVIVSGIINIIGNIKDDDKYVKFSIISKKYTTSLNNNVYVSLNISRELYYKYLDFFYKDSKVFIKGYLNSYKTDNKIQNFITVIDISNKLEDITKGRKYPHIRYDSDGVMVWNGKRCESKIPTEKDHLKMKKLLEEFK